MTIFCWMTLAVDQKRDGQLARHVANGLKKVASKGATFILLWLFILLSACSRTDKAIGTVTGFAMGTSYTVKWVRVDGVDDSAFTGQINALIGTVEDSMSTYIDASDLSGFNGAAINTWVSVPDALVQLVAQAQGISEETNGAFDITIGKAVNAWGFGPHGRPEVIPDFEQLQALKPLVGYQSIQVQQQPPALKKSTSISIDLSAIAKGYGVDNIALWLEQQGIHNYLVEIGGELRAKGAKPSTNTHSANPWRIAIESPMVDARDVFQVIRVKNQAIATSGNYRNYYEENGVRYSHTLNPKTLRPVTHKLASITVMADNAARADALATALMVMGDKEGPKWAAEQGVAAFFIWREGNAFVSSSVAGFSAFIEP